MSADSNAIQETPGSENKPAPNPGSGKKIRAALLGFSIPVMEAMDKAGVPFVGVVPPDFESYMSEHNIPYVCWSFGKFNEHSGQLTEKLQEMGVDFAVPLYEETVEWSGALNGVFRDDPRLFNRGMLFRDKAMMKRKALMSGIRVGVFEEADNKEDLRKFFKRVNHALLKLDHEENDPIHLKPTSAAGCKGHRFIRSYEDIEMVPDEEFPCLLESHLAGKEFSCEVFIHKGKIRFLNITEYTHLGYSNFVPASPLLEDKRPLIEKAVYQLIKAFGVEYGMIHPEFFISPDDEVHFGEVAARIPGGHIFELIQRAYGFDPFVGFVLCSDPKATDQELEAFFPKSVSERTCYAGCLMVYPKRKVVSKIEIPEKLFEEPYYENHNLFVPITPKVAERVAFGDHYGTIYFAGEDPEHMRKILLEYENEEFYNS